MENKIRCKKGVNCEHITKAKICNNCWKANAITSVGKLSSGAKEELKLGNIGNPIDENTLSHLIYCH